MALEGNDDFRILDLLTQTDSSLWLLTMIL